LEDADRLLSGDAWRQWCDRLRAAGEKILESGMPEAPRERAEGFRWLTRLLVHAVQMEIEAGDPLHPRFVRYETPTNQWGGPNPDNVYLRARVDPSRSYRVTADVAGVRQLIVSLNEGDMALGEYGVYSERSLDELSVGADGTLELWISPDRRPGNWIPMHPKARLLTIRVFQSDWEKDAAPVFHIERPGAEDAAPPALDPAALARALDRSAHWIEQSVVFWSAYARGAWQRLEPNRASQARTPPGGAEHILYGHCGWQLAEDEALLIELDVPDADYWGFTIHTLGWLESGDFADRQTSLNGHQAHVDSDGRVRIVLAPRDPGVPNWIDSEGRPRGLLVYRWVFARSNPVPKSQVVPLSELRARLPREHPTIDAAARRERLARRRRAAWSRYP